jgi:hypothetical protein
MNLIFLPFAQRVFLFGLLFGVSLGAVFVAMGCDSADYVVVRKAESPDGVLSALLVRRRGHDSLSSDVYYLILSHSGSGMLPNLPKAIHDRPILVVTHGQDLGVQWSGPNAMTIICASCGIRQIDIMEKKASDGSVSITYRGFPD